MMPELHLFILWEKAGPAKEAILRDIQASFDVLQVYQISWSPSLFSISLSRFYGQSLPPGCGKEESCGTGPFILAVVRDRQPSYAVRNTTKGSALVNTRTFDIKARYRSLEGGGVPIHATDTLRETTHDLVLLLGIGPAEFEASNPGLWTGVITPLSQDLVGSRGWESISALFSVLNNTVEYVVLRNFECLPHYYHMESHGDIDILTGDYLNTRLVANATPVFPDTHRVYHTVTIAGENVPFDFRYVGDHYYDIRWQKRMLESRILMEGGFFVPDAENHFYSLLYHAAVHKPDIGTDYSKRLRDMAVVLGIHLDGTCFFNDPSRLRSFLLDYMSRQGYWFTKPADNSVFFNKAVAFGPIARFWSGIREAASSLKVIGKPSMQHGAGTITPLDSSPNIGVQNVLDALRRCKDVSSHSEEIRRLATAPFCENIFSMSRANLLRPFTFGTGKRVLELGCADGALTRHLGETGAIVIAIEMDGNLASIAAERCRDLPNVTVQCGNLTDLKVDEPFDVIMMIGTLGKAHLYVEGNDPIGNIFRTALCQLKPEGELLLATENQLGLKYFSGCAEENSKIPFFGIHDLYVPDAPVTFGKKELIIKLHAAGFANIEFFYPFPDYKRPEVVLAEAALAHEDFRPADLLYRLPIRDYANTSWRAFHENLAWRGIARNGLLGELANSFFVIASAVSLRNSHSKWLAYVFNTNRQPAFVTETVFLEAEEGIVVTKKSLYPDAPFPQDVHFRHHPPPCANYVTGELYATELQRIMARSGSLDEVARWASAWVAHLNQRADIFDNRLLPGDCLDVIPANLVRTSTGDFVEIDAEWSAIEKIPMNWVLIRGLVLAFASSPPSPVFFKMSNREAVERVLGNLGRTLSDRDFEESRVLEDNLQRMTNGPNWKGPFYGEILSGLVFSSACAPTFLDLLVKKQFEFDCEITRVKSTISWRITKPMRFVWNTLIRLFPPRFPRL